MRNRTSYTMCCILILLIVEDVLYIIVWVGHRSPAKGISRTWEFIKYLLGRLQQFIVTKTVQRKKDPCGTPSSITQRTAYSTWYTVHRTQYEDSALQRNTMQSGRLGDRPEPGGWLLLLSLVILNWCF